MLNTLLSRKKVKYAPLDMKHGSARHWFAEGDIIFNKLRWYQIIDVKCYLTNCCPYCVEKPRDNEKYSFHKLIQGKMNIIDNCWRIEKRIQGDGSLITSKWDFCFRCQKEFLIEVFIFKEIPMNIWKRMKAIWFHSFHINSTLPNHYATKENDFLNSVFKIDCNKKG